MNKKVQVTNHFKQIDASKRFDNLEMLRVVLIQIKSLKKQEMIYRKKVR